jgi:hypothetical protein
MMKELDNLTKSKYSNDWILSPTGSLVSSSNSESSSTTTTTKSTSISLSVLQNKPLLLKKQSINNDVNTNQLKSVSANYLDKKVYTLPMKFNLKTIQSSINIKKYNTCKIDDAKCFISNAYDHINESNKEKSLTKLKINENKQSKIVINTPIEANESTFVNSTNKFLLKKYTNSSSLISLSSHDNLSNNECSDSGYTKSDDTNSDEVILNNDENKNALKKLERPVLESPRTKVLNERIIERLKSSVDYSEERRKLLLTKFTEAQELLQVNFLIFVI